MKKKTIRKRARINTFVKTINHKHVMPTRYTLKADFGKINKRNVKAKEGKRRIIRNRVRKTLEKTFFNEGAPKVRW